MVLEAKNIFNNASVADGKSLKIENTLRSYGNFFGYNNHTRLRGVPLELHVVSGQETILKKVGRVLLGLKSFTLRYGQLKVEGKNLLLY